MQKFYWPNRNQERCPNEIPNSTNVYVKEPWTHFNSLETAQQFQIVESDAKSDTSTYPPLSVTVNTNQVNVRKSDSAHPDQPSGRHTVVRLGGGHSGNRCESVSHAAGKWGDRKAYSTPTNLPVRLKQDEKVGQGFNQRNKTWNQSTLLQAEYESGKGHEGVKRKRQSVKNFHFLRNDIEKMAENERSVATVLQGLPNLHITPNTNQYKSDAKLPTRSRQTPRSRKNSKAVSRSKSCDRGGVGSTLLDNLSCMSRSGRTSPTDSAGYHSGHQDCRKDPSGPAQSLANRLRGRMESVNQKMKLIRSRSVERLRDCTPGVRSEVIAVDHKRIRTVQTDAACVYSGPFLGQARAVVDCVQSPYDKDALAFTRDDLIDIIDMNASGLWRGKCGDRVGNFKFVNVEILPTRGRRRSRSRSLRRMKQKPETLPEVMKVLGMEELISVFALNGYEDLTLFKDLDAEELDYLGIHYEKQREKLTAMAELLYLSNATDKENTDSSSDSGDGFSDVSA